MFGTTAWRMVHVTFEFSSWTIDGDNKSVPNQSSCVQIFINTGQASNCQAVLGRRYMVSQTPRRISLRVPGPNPWKEMEERNQFLIEMYNVGMGLQGFNTMISYLAHITICIKGLNWNLPKEIAHVRNIPNISDGSDSESSESALMV